MEGIPDLSALLKGKLQMLSSKSSSAGASEVRPVPTDGDVNSEPPAQSSQKKKASKAKKRSVPLEEAPSSADASEVAAKKKKKKKDSKKRSREEASVEPQGMMMRENTIQLILLGDRLKNVPRRSRRRRPQRMMGLLLLRSLLKAGDRLLKPEMVLGMNLR